MSTMPCATLAVVEEAKVRLYLLSASHPVGRAKAGFFQGYGFSLANWQRLQQALQEHGRVNDVISVERTDFGVKYVVEGPLVTPAGRSPNVRTVWMAGTEVAVPRLITAYPLKEGQA